MHLDLWLKKIVYKCYVSLWYSRREKSLRARRYSSVWRRPLTIKEWSIGHEEETKVHRGKYERETWRWGSPVFFFIPGLTPALVTRTSDALFIADCISEHYSGLFARDLSYDRDPLGSLNADRSQRDFTARVRRNRCPKREWRNV